MEAIKAIITDDEVAARNVLSQLLEMEYPSIEVIAKCHDIPSTVAIIKEQNPDVVFMDIQMPQYAGYEIVNFFDQINFEIIFVTAFDQYAIKAFELNAVDYLVKPINRQRLTQAIEKLQLRVESQKMAERYHLLKESLQSKTHDHIVIAELGKQNIVKLNDIIAIEANGAYSTVYTIGKENLTVTKNIKQFETLLPQDNVFFRSHKSWIVNFAHIWRYAKSKLEINLTNNIIAKLSKYRKEEFEEALKGRKSIP
ncbi:DNA-binding response regulator [Chryseotalea sanaruensis]|uniref:DNA-binding response regulator n=1 Tax=Chryseotalea sanaruensis TaxID=2482724 RepID=A0A401UCH2_9BACT|nr:LytTR family DNA-binding domain-containing protein [Chryseotalea sanaruensis]GCC52587.1 DNA-binding response regulator [Chryseotalea sanaruensis]